MYVGFESSPLNYNLTYYLSYHLIISGIIIHAISGVFSYYINIYNGPHLKLNSIHAFAFSEKCVLPGPSDPVIWLMNLTGESGLSDKWFGNWTRFGVDIYPK